MKSSRSCAGRNHQIHEEMDVLNDRLHTQDIVLSGGDFEHRPVAMALVKLPCPIG
jgi:hypothetical protein